MTPYNYGFDFLNQVFGNTGMGPTWGGAQNYMQEQPAGDGYDGSSSGQQPVGTQPYSDMFPPGFTGYPGYMGPPQAGGDPTQITNNDQGLIKDGNYDGSLTSQMQLPPSQGGFSGPLAPQYSSQVGANQQMLQGGIPGQMLGQMNPLMQGTLNNAFGGGFNNQIGDWQSGFTPGQTGFAGAPMSQNTPFAGAPMAGATPYQGFNGSVANNMSGIDPSGAINQALSGQPNYDAVQGAVQAGAQPMLDMLFEDVMPQLRTQTNASNNPTGEIKDTNRIVPRVMRDIGNMGQQAALGEYNRAMGSRDQAAGLAGNLGLGYENLGQQSNQFGSNLGQQLNMFNAGQGLQGNMFGANLNQANNQFNAGQGLQANMFGSNLGQEYQNMLMGNSQFNAGLGLQSDQSQQSAWDNYMGQALGLGGLGAGLAGQAGSQMGQGVGQWGDVFNQGMSPFGFGQGYGQFASGFENQALQDAMNQWNYGQQQPYNNMDWFSQILSGSGGLGGQTTTQQPGADPMTTAAGLFMSVAPYLPWSDRRLKRDIEPIGAYAGHNWYRYNYIWGEPGIGVMADEIPARFVHTTIDGLKMVDYAALLRG